MADSNSQSPRCPCGFWGTPQTGGLCSKCFKEKEQNRTDCGAASTGGGLGLPSTDLNTPLEQAMSSSSIQDLGDSSSGAKALVAAVEESLTRGAGGSVEDTNPETSSPEDSSSGAEVSAGSPVAASDTTTANNKRDISEVADPAEAERPVQKNKRRCFKCNLKLELAMREIGKCKCNYIFCQLHRLPEQHDCVYDHKEKGRLAARDKMVSPKKHAGTSIKRMDSYS